MGAGLVMVFEDSTVNGAEPALPAAKIIVADDHPLVCAALTQMLRAAMATGTVLTASTLAALESALQQNPDVDLAMLDLHMPGARGFSSLLVIRGQRPELPVVVISGDDHPRTIARARQFGAAGFLSKSAPVPVVLAAIAAVLRGETWFPQHAAGANPDDVLFASRLAQLTPQQMRVLICIADGLLNKQIAHELNLAENTVKVHVAAVLHKLRCQTRTHAAVLVRALESGDEALSLLPQAVGTE